MIANNGMMSRMKKDKRYNKKNVKYQSFVHQKRKDNRDKYAVMKVIGKLKHGGYCN